MPDYDKSKLKRISFRVEAPILGYRASTKRAFDPKYKEYKNRVLIEAMAVGYVGKCVALKEAPPFLAVKVYWKKNPRIDFKNVYGSVEDGLFSEDSYVLPGPDSGVWWDHGEEFIEVFLDVPKAI